MPTPTTALLIVEDDADIAASLSSLLAQEYAVTVRSNRDTAYAACSDNGYAAILLDITLPDGSGIELCRTIRKTWPERRIIMVTAEESIDTKVLCLDIGADDYLTKPYNHDELRARLRAVLRPRPQIKEEILTIADLCLNVEQRMVARNGTPLTLRRKEFDILTVLVRNIDRVISRSTIINNAWDYASDPYPGTVDVHIKNLRDKVDRPFKRKLITTIPGVGYAIRSEPTKGGGTND